MLRLPSVRWPVAEFLTRVKRLTITGYYTSQLGLSKVVGYKGEPGSIGISVLRGNRISLRRSSR